MNDVLNKDRAAFIRQLENSNPDSRMDAQYAPSIDFTKHIRNLSVRYVSTILPNEHNLDDWIVLPLFQHGQDSAKTAKSLLEDPVDLAAEQRASNPGFQDIPIDNDGRTAILLAHAPSLQRLLEMWHDKTDGEWHDRKERRRQRKAERRESRHRKRAEKRKLKESLELDTQVKLYKSDSHLPHARAGNTMCASKLDSFNNGCYSGVAKKGSDSINESSRILQNNNLKHFDSRNHQTDNVSVSDGIRQEGSSNSQLGRTNVIDVEESQNVGLDTLRTNFPNDSDCRVKQKAFYNDGSGSEVDDCDGITAMENQIACIRTAELSQEVKMVEDVNCEMRLESDHAAYNLERELNGEPMECKKFTESLLRVESSFVMEDRLPEPSPEQRPSKTELKKHSASNKVKTSLLQRMAEGYEVDVDATNAAASENDYRNTFCYLCRVDFSTSKGLYLHNVKLHSEGEVQCDVCYKPLKNRITLMKHKKLHLGAEDMHCMCTECGRPFKDKRALTAHVTYTRHMLSLPSTSQS